MKIPKIRDNGQWIIPRTYVRSGGVWVLVDNFIRNAGDWDNIPFLTNVVELATTLTPLTGGSQYGKSVAIGNGRIVVGAPGYNYDDSPVTNSGLVYVYDTNGNQITTITNNKNPAQDTRFGVSVAVGSNIIAVGANREDNSKGAVYIYDLNGNFIRRLQPSSTVGNFGLSVAIGEGFLGAPILVVGNSLVSTNKIYIYYINSDYDETIFTTSDYTVATKVAIGNGKIVVGNGGSGTTGMVNIFDTLGIGRILLYGYGSTRFGSSVAVGNNLIVIGASDDDTQSNNNGAVYVYDLSGSFIRQIFPSDRSAFLGFGNSVAVSDNRIVVGTFGAKLFQFKLDGTELGSILDPDPASIEDWTTSISAGEGKIVVGSPNNWFFGTPSSAELAGPPGSVYLLS
jgi:hypothetical protein